ncbi:MAG: hypothetical protein LBS43_12330 [Prevotellaceae bacterium]|jgi:hypothetical protein|nr:hypothetical protein [Prevotellaceae bacterium]
MAYNKDSGESKLRKNVNQDTYTRKKNKNIFKNSQTSTQPPPKSQRKSIYEWEIPDVEIDNNIPNIEEFNFEPNKTETPKYERDNLRYEKKEPQNFYEYERQRRDAEKREKETGDKRSLLSFMDIIAIVAANGFFPIIGGFVYYIILASKGERQKAAQSIVLSAIVSFIRILYIINVA